MNKLKTIAIHQPNFFPWLGYFNKIARSDVFVLLDNVQFPKKGGTWCNRVQILINEKASWLTLPVVRSYHGVKLINEIKINSRISWRRKALKTIEINYARAPFFEQIYPVINELLAKSPDSLSEFNVKVITEISKKLGFDISKLVLGSTLGVEGKATDLLISSVRALKGTAYLCGGGADGYQKDHKFQDSDIQLIYQNFVHPVYPQRRAPNFIEGLSVIDPLMHCGFEITRELILKN